MLGNKKIARHILSSVHDIKQSVHIYLTLSVFRYKEKLFFS